MEEFATHSNLNSRVNLDDNICNSLQIEFVRRKKGGAIGSGEPLPMAASVSSTVICCHRLVLESVIPVLAVVTISATGEDERTYDERNYD